MKHKLLLSIAMIFILAISNAQTPQKFNYQAVARDTSGNLFTNKNVSFRISILQGSADGTNVYQETHQKTTNAYGQATLIIGLGTVVSGNFNTINWGSNSYYIKTEMKLQGGADYILMGTSQLLSVPYALYSNTSGNGFSGAYADLAGKPSLFDGTWLSLTGKPTLWDSTWASIKNKPSFFDGNYNSLTNKPTLFSGAYADLAGKPSLFDGTWLSLTGKPTLWDST